MKILMKTNVQINLFSEQKGLEKKNVTDYKCWLSDISGFLNMVRRRQNLLESIQKL